VRGNIPEEARAVQVQLRGASLNSNDVFVLVGESSSFLWCGKGSTGDEREIAKKIAARDRVDCITVYEGQERDEFWAEIGGKEEYANDKRLASESNDSEPRLFQCSNATGILKAEEIVNFGQVDLCEDDCMLLDIGDTVFLWYGKDSNKEEREGSIMLAQKYLRSDPAGRDVDTPLLIVKQGMEPPTFTGHFGIWDRSLWSNNQTFAELKAQMKSEQPVLSASAITLIQTNGVDFESAKKYPLDVLSEKELDKLPIDVNPSLKEVHLSKSDFQSVFNMDYATFSDLPQWKKKHN